MEIHIKTILQAIKYQLELIYIALSFLTRLPVPSVAEYSEQKLNQARRYFPLVGIIVGSICAAVLFCAAQYFPIVVAVLLSMIISLMITGVFHEDGLADTADGIGGGWTVEQKLNIMKDSRIGTYGTVAIWSVLSLKLILLTMLARISLDQTALALIAIHSVSRALSGTLVSTLPYARTSSTKPVVEFHARKDSVIAWLIALFALIPIAESVILLLPALIALLICWHLFLKRQLGGYTGDTLGAAQQLAELLCYLVLLWQWQVAPLTGSLL